MSKGTATAVGWPPPVVHPRRPGHDLHHGEHVGHCQFPLGGVDGGRPRGDDIRNLWFNRVPEPKTAKNRLHFDLRATGSVADEVRRLAGLGAVVTCPGDNLVSMQDPEGNEFCVE